MDHELTRFPPILQLVGLALLGAFVLLSVLGRVSSRFAWVWDDPDEARTTTHLLEYTVVPALMLVAAAAAVVWRWDPAAPLLGGWTLKQLTLGPIAALVGFVLVVLTSTIGRRGGWLQSEAGQRWAWVPLLVMLAGMGLMATGILTLGRTLK